MTSRIHPITMPKWGIEMQEGTITAWQVAPGQRVAKGDPLLDVETEKIVNSVEAPVDGILRRVLAPTGETHAVGALIAVFADPDVGDGEIDAFIARFRPADASFEPVTQRSEAPAAVPTPGGGEIAIDAAGEVRVSPIARRLAEQLGVDLSLVKGTGRNGRISREDVEAFAANMARAAAKPAETTASVPARRERLSAMRATIARRLIESSQTIPHFRLVADLEVAQLIARRAALVSGGCAVSLNDLLLRAIALALIEHPMVNAQFTGEEVLHFDHADLAIVVATPTGLVTPIIRAADTKSIAEIARESRDLRDRARAGRLSREEITGGTFTVSNLGMFGVTQFDAIVNPPQVAILAVGAATERIVAQDGRPIAKTMMTVTLSSDHRVVDGAVAGAFLETLRACVASPDQL